MAVACLTAGLAAAAEATEAEAVRETESATQIELRVDPEIELYFLAVLAEPAP